MAGTRTHVSWLAVVLATLTPVATACRTQLAFRQLRLLADLRRQATTDDLTGLPNRRAFYEHVNGRLAGPATHHAPTASVTTSATSSSAATSSRSCSTTSTGTRPLPWH